MEFGNKEASNERLTPTYTADAQPPNNDGQALVDTLDLNQELPGVLRKDSFQFSMRRREKILPVADIMKQNAFSHLFASKKRNPSPVHKVEIGAIEFSTETQSITDEIFKPL